MLRTSENETEILLGNKQLLGIFFVIAVLLGIAFTGGYMVGRGSGEKKAASVATSVGPAAPSTSAGGGETHSVAAAPSAEDTQSSAAPTVKNGAAVENEAPLGSPKRSKAEKRTETAETETPPASAETTGHFVPESGQTFLQVAATTRDEAEGVADVLHKRGFRAHAVPKPGNPRLYRVLIGPMRDAGDLSNTREALRKTGFREVIVQKY